ncbi:hypothetical protein [Arthrobacter sp. NicSoilB4]|uniref:hypothetical protein n=1 Tax=Arthrobacter sp. NicSoilB4 TaxID=2830997 RepID=UPI001CC3A3D4|nr:hypothetical protein [Arthrobacter sp. NicSoilB4]
MTLMIVVSCTLLLVTGVGLVIAFGGRPVRTPAALVRPASGPETLASVFLRYLWGANVATVAAVASAFLVAWPGGRLAMRILALTSPLSAQGRLTEAQAVIGIPSVEGTLALLIFAGLPAGFAAAFIYMLIRRWLPAGRLGGPALGLLLLLAFGASVDPLRPDNIDFEIVEPGWLAVVLFAALATLHGALVAAVAGAVSDRLQPLARKTWKSYLPLLAAVLFPPAGLVLGIGALLVMAKAKIFSPRPEGSWRQPRAVLRAGRGILLLVSLAALPMFVGAVTSIAAR